MLGTFLCLGRLMLGTFSDAMFSNGTFFCYWDVFVCEPQKRTERTEHIFKKNKKERSDYFMEFFLDLPHDVGFRN